MNIEVKRNIEIDSVLKVLKDRAETNQVGKMGKEVVIEKETLQDAIHVIEVLVKKNKQLRDINKNLTDKITRKNNTISELSKQAKELNDKLFEIQKEFDSCKNDTCNNCCKKKESEEYQNYDGKPKKCKEQHEKEYDLKDVLNELEVINELVVVGKLIGIL